MEGARRKDPPPRLGTEIVPDLDGVTTSSAERYKVNKETYGQRRPENFHPTQGWSWVGPICPLGLDVRIGVGPS